jgi:hypothetical protein
VDAPEAARRKQMKTTLANCSKEFVPTADGTWQRLAIGNTRWR